jgi:hypothetical protein
MPGRIRPGMTGSERMKKQQAVDERKAQLAEDAYRKMIQQGKVTPANKEKIKAKIARDFGFYPLGDTN